MSSAVTLTFPDGNSREFDRGVTASEVAASIAVSLRKRAISAVFNGEHWDLQWPIDTDGSISINTMNDEGYALELIRHDLAHIMARAVQELWPETQVTIGPSSRTAGITTLRARLRSRPTTLLQSNSRCGR